MRSAHTALEEYKEGASIAADSGADLRGASIRASAPRSAGDPVPGQTGGGLSARQLIAVRLTAGQLLDLPAAPSPPGCTLRHRV